MLEEIKKEIEENKIQVSLPLDSSSYYTEEVIEIDELFEILDKYNNQPDYKSAFEEIVQEFFKEDDKHSVTDRVRWKIQEVKQKYNLLEIDNEL